jgi:hypothetical protein
VSRIGSADNAAAQTVFARYGLKGDDVGYLTIGSVPARLAALQSNAIQATLLQPPETLKAKELGVKALMDFTKLDVEWQQNGVADFRIQQAQARHGAPLYARHVEAGVYNSPIPKARKSLAKISYDQRR